ncbi:MAG: argininosuccinate lyase [Bacteroidales bacterium]|nr:argininosuccinate lyase [Bacteroidales bacterium]
MKLWEKGYNPDKQIENFTVGKDPILDMELLPYDIQGSIAHAAVLCDAGVLKINEKEEIVSALEDLHSLWSGGKFSIKTEDEDGHTAIENYLTEKLGDLGKKIHTARSRNDQVITAMRLYEKDQLNLIAQKSKILINNFEAFSKTYMTVPMPGFTHTRKAMPYSVGEWAQAHGDALMDDLKLLNVVQDIIDQNPLGTGAGFGVPFPLNREISTEILGFSNVMRNSVYAQNSRGKFEGEVLQACTAILMTLNRWASDLILFTMPDFGFFALADELTTGSSIMPHKKNPDVLELIRASVHQLIACQTQVQNISLNLISGYHRDIQLTKEPVMTGLQSTLDCLIVASKVIDGLSVNKDKLQDSMTDDLYSVKKVYDLVRKGIPFREAYKIIASKLFS